MYYPYGFLAMTAASFGEVQRSGLILWLDGADSSSMTNDGANLISQWRDKSGQNNHANATTTQRPTLTANVRNGKSGLRFNGSSNFFTLTSAITSTGEFTRFVVVMNQAIATQKFYFGHTTNMKEGYANFTPIRYALRVVTSVETTQNYPIAQNNYGLIWSARDSANKVDYSFNNSAAVRLFSDAAQTGNNIVSQIGKDETTNFWQGDICEMLVFNRRLTNGEIELVKQYLNTKWALY